MQILDKTDMAVLVSDATRELMPEEKELIAIFKKKKIPYITILNKCDLIEDIASPKENVLYTSATKKINTPAIAAKLASMAGSKAPEKRILGDLLEKGDVVVLVTPIDEAAPKGRLILPQVQTIRGILDGDAICVVTKENTLAQTLEMLKGRVKLCVCDSQVFKLVDSITPPDVMLTSFSILMARFKGYLETAYKSIKTLEDISSGDKILISEGCSHHRQCGDIGTVKLPNLIKKYTGKTPVFEFTQGSEFPSDLSEYKLVIHCGGCMLNEREVTSRMNASLEKGIPFSNYGIAIAYMNGIIDRSTRIFEELK